MSDMNYIQGSAATGPRRTGGAGADAGAETVPAPAPAAAAEDAGGGLTVRGLPLVKPPYGSISAIDMNKGEIVWQIAHGETPDNVRNNPALKGLNIPRTGQAGVIGTLVTKTLVIAGDKQLTTRPDGKRSAMLRAYDKVTGKELGAVAMPNGQTGTPMTYLYNGKQYIVIAIGGQGYPAELLAFKLP